MSTLVRYPVPAARQDAGVGLSRIITPPVAGTADTTPPVHETFTSIAGAAGRTNLSFTAPPSLVDDNIVEIGVFKENTAAITPPTGFALKDQAATDSPVQLSVFWGRAPAIGAGPFNFTWTGATFAGGSAHRVSGAITSGDPYDITSIVAEAGAGDANTPDVAVTTGTANCLATWFGAGFSGGGTWTPPTSFTEILQVVNYSAAVRTLVSAGGTGVIVGTQSGTSPMAAWVGVLKPLPVGGGQSATANQVTETDIANALSRSKFRIAAQTTETDTAQPIARAKTRVVSQAIETDVAQPITATGGNPFPTTIGGIHPESNNRMGPFIDGNGNLYTCTELSAADPRASMRKSSNGGVTWAEVDSANRPAHDDLESLWVEQRGTVLYLLFQRSGTMRVTHCTFNTSDAGASPDTWQVKDEVVHLPTTAPANQAVSLAVRSNGDLLAFYRTDPVSTFQRVAWRKKPSGGAWSAETQVDTTASTNFTQVAVVVGASDKVHVLYKNDTTSAVWHKSLTSADSLSASEVVNDNATTTDDQMMTTPPVYLDVAGTERVYVAWKRSSTGFLVGAAIENDGTPLAEEAISDVAVWEDVPVTTSEQSVATLAADTAADKIYALYSDNATHDLFRVTRNGTWGANSEVLDAVEVQYVAATVFTHGTQGQSKRVLGVIFDDNPTGAADAGVPKYTQITLGPPPLGQPAETDSGQPVGRLKTRTVGQVTETDTAQPITRVKTRAIGQATETDVAQVITSFQAGVVVLSAPVPYNMAAPLGIVTLGQVVETDIAQPITRVKTLALGQVIETDTAQALSRQKVRVAQQATETDIVQAIVAGVRTGTQLHLTTVAAESGVTVGTGTRHRFHWDAGASSTIRNKNTVAGPTAPLQVTDSATPGTDGDPVSWYSNQLETVTIAGAITIELWAEESGG